MFQDSIQLFSEYNRLLQENSFIKDELSKVDVKFNLMQALRSQRQTLISSVQGVISEKSKELRPELKSSSWLVFKLKKQIHLLKKQIEQKDKTLADFSKNKFNEILREKQDEKDCMESLLKDLRVPSDEPSSMLDELYQLREYERSQQDRIEELEVPHILIQERSLNLRKASQKANRINHASEVGGSKNN